MQTIANLLSVTRKNTHIVAIAEHQQYCWGEFVWLVERLAKELTLADQKRWLLFHENSYVFALGFFALLAANKDIVLPPNAQRGVIEECLSDVDAVLGDGVLNWVACDTSTPYINLTEAIDSSGGIDAEVGVDIYIDRSGNPGSDEAACLSQIGESTSNLYILTSGSTGRPKKIRKTIAQLDAELQCLEHLWGGELGQAVVFSTVSHQHIYGLLFRLLWPLCAGRPFFSRAHPYPEHLVRDIAKLAKPSVIVSSPAHLGRWPQSLDVNNIFSGVNQIFSSGGALTSNAALQISASFRKAVTEVLGSSETGGVAWRRQQSLAEEPWTLLPSVRGRIAENSGILEIASEFAGGYGWVAMGDLATFLSIDKFMLHGRADRIVKVEGKRLSLSQIENLIRELGCVSDCRALVLSARREQVAVVVELSREGIDTLKASGKPYLVALIGKYLEPYLERVLLPRKFRFVEQLPVNTQGKTTQHDLQSLFATHLYRDSVPVTIYYLGVDGVLLTIDLLREHSIFDGHFVDEPILAGVFQIDLAISQTRHFFYPEGQFKRMERIKFRKLIRPMRGLLLSIDNKGGGVVNFQYTLGRQVLSSGKMYFEVES